MKNQSGYSLLEILLVVAMLGLLTALSLPISQAFFVQNDLNVAVDTTVQSLRRGQILAKSSDGDSQWGVRIQSGSLIVFKGSSYAARDTTYDETYSIAGSIAPSGVNEVVFDKLSGKPTSTGSIIYTASTGASKTITINSQGMVDYL